MGRSKRFLVWKRHKRRDRRARQKVKLYLQGQLKPEELPRLARRLLAKRQRVERRQASA